MIKLIDGEEKYLKEYKEAYILSLEKWHEGVIKKHNVMFSNPDEVDILQRIKDNRDQSKLPPEYVPSYDYFVIDGDKFIGIVHIRIRLTESLLRYGGHIGYAINPKYWCQGYGTEALKLALEKALELGIEDVLITCDNDNIGSSKIIEKNGGVLENTVPNTSDGEEFLTNRYWIRLNRKESLNGR